MSRELRSDPVLAVDSSGGITEVQPEVPLQYENIFTASTSDAVPAAAEPDPMDDRVRDEPSSVSNETSSLRHEEDPASGVSAV